MKYDNSTHMSLSCHAYFTVCYSNTGHIVHENLFVVCLVSTPLINKTCNAHWSETRKCLLTIAFKHAISKVQVNQRQLKLHSKHQLQVCADYSYFWVERAITTIKKTTDVLLVASYKVGLEVNAEETKCKFISQEQNAEKYVCRHKANGSLRRWQSG